MLKNVLDNIVAILILYERHGAAKELVKNRGLRSTSQVRQKKAERAEVLWGEGGEQG